MTTFAGYPVRLQRDRSFEVGVAVIVSGGAKGNKERHFSRKNRTPCLLFYRKSHLFHNLIKGTAKNEIPPALKFSGLGIFQVGIKRRRQRQKHP